MKSKDITMARKWLESAEYIEQEIAALRYEQSRIISKGLVSAPFSSAKLNTCAASDNATERRNIDYAEYSKRINEYVQNLCTLKNDIHSAIEAIPKAAYRILLYERYINHKNFTEISFILNYSYDHVIKDLHPAALRAVVVPEKYKENC